MKALAIVDEEWELAPKHWMVFFILGEVLLGIQGIQRYIEMFCKMGEMNIADGRTDRHGKTCLIKK